MPVPTPGHVQGEPPRSGPITMADKPPVQPTVPVSEGSSGGGERVSPAAKPAPSGSRPVTIR